jgi:hypothetical protein
MKRNRTVVMAAFILLCGSTAAQAQDRDHNYHKKQEHQREKIIRAELKHERLTSQEQQRLIREQEQRNAIYRAQLDRQVRLAQERNARLQAQRRLAEYRVQQNYIANLQRQQAALRAQRNYSNDPAYYTAPTYRYRVNNVTRTTNQYGVETLKQAVNYGYEQGIQYGRADRQDRAAYNYRDSYAYQDANYGYNGNYVSQSDYNAYFREGFRRGYDDGFYARSQYGTTTTNGGSILSNLLNSILGLAPIQ